MTESHTPKPNQQIISKLQSGNLEQVTETMGELRETGDSTYIPVLIDLLHSSRDSEISAKILTFLADIKNSDVIHHLLDAIQNEKYINERKNLVAICWQNRFDFSPNLPLFIDLLVREEFEVALEAYTVITNMTGKINTDMLTAEIAKIKSLITKVDEQKQQLLMDVIDFLPQLSI